MEGERYVGKVEKVAAACRGRRGWRQGAGREEVVHASRGMQGLIRRMVVRVRGGWGGWQG